jgi:hypothetical protein
VYDIEKGNTNRILKSIWPLMKKKGNVMEILEDEGAFILFMSQEICAIKGGALDELVKC